MAAGVRDLSVLGEFKPFGLIAEALDGKPTTDNVSDKYDYFLFDPQLTRERDDFVAIDSPASSSDGCDHEIFIRGNRIMWITGSCVYKRFTLSSAVTMACWCHMAHSSEAVLCILQVDALTIFNTTGELTSIPLPGIVTSIWPLPFGLLVQQAAEGNPPTYAPLSTSVPYLRGRDTFSKREIRQSPQQSFGFSSSEHFMKGNLASVSSHLILNGPLEEPQPVYIDERGELKIMKNFDERTIWTSDRVPLVASYNRDSVQHSLWVAEHANPFLGEHAVSGSHVNHTEVSPCQFSFRRIWQAKGHQTAATKVFLATDDDVAPVICFLLQEQKRLLSVRLHTVEINDDVLFDVKPDLSWSIHAVAAEPVVVTRPWAKVGLLPLMDILVLDSENTVFLYSGKQCLCKYVLPLSLGIHQLKEVIDRPKSRCNYDVKIIGLADAVGARVNVILSNGQMLRCALRRGVSCSLANDCIAAMAEGLSSPFYNHFLQLFWANSQTADWLTANSSAKEWEYFRSIIMQFYRNSQSASQSDLPCSAWDFLVDSEFHKNYLTHNHFPGISTVGLNGRRVNRLCASNREDVHDSDGFPISKFLIECLDSLHAVYENLKLVTIRKRDLEHLVVLLCEIANFLGEESYIDHYVRDFPFQSKTIITQNWTSFPRSPPCLYRWLESCLLHGVGSAKVDDIPPLVRKNGSSAVSWSRKVVSFYSLLSGAKSMGGKLSSGLSCKIAPGSSSTPEEKMVLAMVAEGFGLQQLDLLPIGVSLPLRHAVDKCRESPPTGWPAAAYVLLGREDLALSLSCVSHSKKSEELETPSNRHLISMSAPYMLHLQSVTIPSTVSDTVAMDTSKVDNIDSSDDSPIDGMEHLFNSSTQLRYGRDLRLNEVRRLLCSARPVAIQTSVNPTASDQELQQAELWQFAQRTTALPLGRGAFTLATSCTLLTEALSVPKLVLAGRLPAQQNATVNLDPNARNLQELRAWPEFHNAVAAGLKLSPFQGKVSRTWIIYNRPEEPNAAHAGLLFALGLHGHLTVLSINDIFEYYNKGHEITTVGLMLGLAASYRGTMEPTMSKSFYVHLPARHPSAFPELEVPTVLQSAALMSLGLLFEGSAHPQTMHFLLAEIGRRSGGDNVLEREGYSVSAGFALGLVALGRGEDKFTCVDSLVDRLFHYAGEKSDVFSQGKSPLTPVTNEPMRGLGQWRLDGGPVNVDVTAPGAIIALALLFLKTESEVIVSRLSIPQTNFELQYLRPDFIMLRVIARNLIMWNRVKPTKEWVESQIPQIVKEGVEALGDESNDMEEVDEEAVVQAYMNIVAGACISLGLKFAGSRNANAQDLLYNYAIYFLNEIKSVSSSAEIKVPKGLLKFVDRSTLELCLHLAVLSLALVMAGSGNLKTFRLLRFLRSRNSSDGQANFGIQMTVSLATGFLFLGGGMQSFSSNKGAIAALLVTLYPRLPTGTNDNRCHLQAYRHFYVLATEARWIQTVDVDTGLPVYAPLEITVKETEQHAETSFCEVTPCLLPERSILKSVRVCGPRYWPQVIELIPEDKPWWLSGELNHPFNSGVLYIKRKVGACSYVDDPAGCQSLISRAMNKAFSLTSMRCYDPKINRNADPGSSNVDRLVSTFSSDPSLIAFAQLCCDSSWNNRSDVDFQEFCLQVLFECVSKDRPALLQVYMSLYTMMRSMTEQATGDAITIFDSLSMTSLKLVVAYNEALLRGRLTSSRDAIVQSNFLGSLRKRIEELFCYSHELQTDLRNYLTCGKWPDDEHQGEIRSISLSWYLQWFCVPSPHVIKTTVKKIKPKLTRSSAVPLLRLCFPRIHVRVISEIDNILLSG